MTAAPRPAGRRARRLAAAALLPLLPCGTAPPAAPGPPSPTATPVAPTASPAFGEAVRTLVDADFEDARPGPVDPRSFSARVGKSTPVRASYDAMTYVRDADGRTFVRTRLAAGAFLGRNDAPGDGNVLVVGLGDPEDERDREHDAACVTYDVRFSAGFAWSAGGKLPGLLGVAPGVSPGEPTGGGSTERGWSGRVMWLGPSLSRTVRESGQPDLAASYLYHPGQAGRYGDDLYWGRGFVDGVWHQVRQCYRLNTVGQADGVLEAWLDGIPVLQRTDLVYRTDPAVHVTHLDWSVFRGGDDARWAASTPGDVDLDSVLVTVS